MKNFRSVLSLVLALLMVFSCFAAFAAEDDMTANGGTATEIVTKFSDVDSKSTVGKAVSNLALMGVVTGYPDGTFLPDGNITRAEFSAICVRLANLANGIGTDAVTGFSDLDADDSYKWARPYVLMAKEQGIISGYPDGTFGAGNQVTYEEAVAMLMRMRGWDTACRTETTVQQSINPAASWSYGYVKLAIQQGLTANTNSNDIERVKPATRGTVAVLANNALSVKRLEAVVDKNTGDTVYVVGTNGGSGGSGSSGSATNDKNVEIVSGTVNGTYLTNLSKYKDEIGRYEIVVGNDLYEVDNKVLDKLDIYDLLGQKVKMTYNKKSGEVTAIDITNTDTLKIYSGYPGSKANFVVEISDSGVVEYTNNPETYRTYEKALSGNVIYNGKYIDDFDFANLSDPDSEYPFTNGVIEIFENRKPALVKISNYSTCVVSSASGSTINLFYKDSASRKIDIPVETDSDYFVFRRNGKTNISSASDISRYDVLSVLESPADAEGPSIKIVESTRNSKLGLKIDRVNESDPTIFEVKGTHYQYNYDYKLIADGTVSTSEKIPELVRGTESINFYFDHIGQIAAVTTSTSATSTSGWMYGYLLSMLQNDRDSDYDLEFYILNSSGKKQEYGTGAKFKLNGKSYKSGDEDIEELLRESAQDVNNYDNCTHLVYQQPIRFKTNSSGQVAEMITAAPAALKDIADEDELLCNSPYEGERLYTSSSGFTDFRISSATIAFLVPDDRTSYDDYKLIRSSDLTSGRKYQVEGYNIGVTSTNRADLMVIYNSIDSTEYTYKTPFIIVDYTDYDDDDNPTIVGYKGSTSGIDLKRKVTLTVNTKKLSSEAKDAYNSLSRGDIVRYLCSTSDQSEVIDLIVWFDASDAIQAESVGSVDEAIDNRIIAVTSSSADGINGESGDRYNAAFRLAYGTVLSHDETDKIITVSPTIASDDMEMAQTGSGVVGHKYSTSTVKVLAYTKRGGLNIFENTEDGLAELLTYDDYADDASVVITFTTGDSTSYASYLRMIYIITE